MDDVDPAQAARYTEGRSRFLILDMTLRDPDKPSHPGWTTMVLVRRDLLDGGPRRGDAAQDEAERRVSACFVELYKGWHLTTPEEDHLDPVETTRRVVEGPDSKGHYG